MTATFDRVEYTTKQTATAVRAALREAFPGVKFSVRMARGTAYGWLDVQYTDGPTWEQVRQITNGFQSRQFDGMDDSYKTIEPTLYTREDGSLYEIRWACCGVNITRSYSDVVNAWAERTAVRGSRWWPDGLDLWRDNAYYSTRELLAGLDLTHGTPDDPAGAWRDRWHRADER